MTGVVDAGATGAARTGNSSARFWVSVVRKSALGKTRHPTGVPAYPHLTSAINMMHHVPRIINWNTAKMPKENVQMSRTLHELPSRNPSTVVAREVQMCVVVAIHPHLERTGDRVARFC